MATLDERYGKGRAMRVPMAGGGLGHFTPPVSTGWRRTRSASLRKSYWRQPEPIWSGGRVALHLHHLEFDGAGATPWLPRHIERCLNLRLAPEKKVEVFI